MGGRAQTERECMSRLYQMEVALAEMEPQLPDDMRALGAEARQRVSFWLTRIGAGGADLQALSSAMAELTSLMESLTARLLLAPWDNTSRGPRS
jgi:hypothetical protein